MEIIGLILVGGAMFGLGFLTSLWITFGAVWVKAEPTYWTTTPQTSATSRTPTFTSKSTTAGPPSAEPTSPRPSPPPLPPPNYSLMGTTKDGPLSGDYGNRRTPPPPPESD